MAPLRREGREAPPCQALVGLLLARTHCHDAHLGRVPHDSCEDGPGDRREALTNRRKVRGVTSQPAVPRHAHGQAAAGADAPRLVRGEDEEGVGLACRGLVGAGGEPQG